MRSVRGLRKVAVSALRSGRIDVYPAYSGSLLEFLGGKSLRSALARLKAEPLARARAQDRNVFAMKSAKARELGISKLSDLAQLLARRTCGRRAGRRDERQDEQWAIAPDSVLDLPDAWALSQGAGVTVAIVDSGIKLDHPDLGAERLDQLRRGPRQRRRR